MEDQKVVLSMSYPRSQWVSVVTSSLAGIVGEYAKLQMAKLSGYPHNWEPEVKRLMKKLETFMDPKVVKTSEKFDREKAFVEAVIDVSVRDDKVTQAKNIFIEKLGRKSTLKFLDEFSKHGDNFDAAALVVDVLRDYSKTLYGILKKQGKT